MDIGHQDWHANNYASMMNNCMYKRDKHVHKKITSAYISLEHAALVGGDCLSPLSNKHKTSADSTVGYGMPPDVNTSQHKTPNDH